MALASSGEVASTFTRQTRFGSAPKHILAIIVLAFLLAIVFIYTSAMTPSRLHDQFLFSSPKTAALNFPQTDSIPKDSPALTAPWTSDDVAGGAAATSAATSGRIYRRAEHGPRLSSQGVDPWRLGAGDSQTAQVAQVTTSAASPGRIYRQAEHAPRLPSRGVDPGRLGAGNTQIVQIAQIAGDRSAQIATPADGAAELPPADSAVDPGAAAVGAGGVATLLAEPPPIRASSPASSFSSSPPTPSFSSSPPAPLFSSSPPARSFSPSPAPSFSSSPPAPSFSSSPHAPSFSCPPPASSFSPSPAPSFSTSSPAPFFSTSSPAPPPASSSSSSSPAIASSSASHPDDASSLPPAPARASPPIASPPIASPPIAPPPPTPAHASPPPTHAANAPPPAVWSSPNPKASHIPASPLTSSPQATVWSRIPGSTPTSSPQPTTWSRIPDSTLTSPPQATTWTRIPGSTLITPDSVPPPAVWSRIPGSILTLPDKIRVFRARFECITREGAWAHYMSPRLLPWPDEISKCDEYHLGKSTRHVAMQQADHVAAQAQELQAKIAEISGKVSVGAGGGGGAGGAGGGVSLPLNQIKQLRQLEKQLRNHHGKLAKQWTVRETLKYQWIVPEGGETDGQDAADGSSSSSSRKNCGPWEWFDPYTFCRVLHGRRLLIVGDSINMLLADALRFNLRLGAKDPVSRLQWGEPTDYCQRYRNATKPPREPRCWTLDACSDFGFSVRIFFVRDYYLNSTEAVNDFMVDKSFGSRSGETWIEDIGAQNVSIVVMNRGAHFIATPQFQRQMRSTLREVRARYPELLMIVRNTPAGHPGCWMHRKPVNTPLKLPHSDWHWDDFDAQNEVLKRMVEGDGEAERGAEKAAEGGAEGGEEGGQMRGKVVAEEGETEEGIGGVYMDVNGPTVLRADGHVGRWDCLHYCHPGPVDTWVQLLYNMLLGLLGSSYDT